MSTQTSRKGPSPPRLRDNSRDPDDQPWSPAALSDPLEKFGARGSHSVSSYPATSPRKPLIDYVTNEWKHSPRKRRPSLSPADKLNDRFLDAVEAIPDLLRSRRLRRYALIWLLLLVITIVAWNTYLGPAWHEDQRLVQSLSEANRRKAGGHFGTNQRPIFPDMVFMRKLDESLLPKPTAPKKKSQPSSRRLVFVGDVHGCKEELVRLLETVSFDHTTDHLVLLGDLVTKGPESLGVVNLARKLGASCIRGNHEDRILLVHKDLNSTLIALNGPNEPDSLVALNDDLDEQSFSHGDYSDRNLARILRPEQLRYLASCPVILRVGNIGPLGEVVAVHAGLVPGIPLERQDPYSSMSMRSIDLDTHVPSKMSAIAKKGSESDKERKRRMSLVAWTKLWNKYQSMLPNSKGKFGKGKVFHDLHSTVIYGHDSKRGLQLQKWTKGLDTGCVKGGRLTALIVEDGGRLTTKSVPCKDYRPRKPMKVEVEDVLRDGKVSGRNSPGQAKLEDDEDHASA